MNCLSERMLALGTARSEIRELFEYGRNRIAEIGAENVFDFSLGNPSVAAPECVNATAMRLLREENAVSLHGYTSAQGDAGVRSALAADLNRRFGTAYTGENLYLTMGAAAGLCCCFHALACPGDRFVVIAPFFPEYKVFIESAGAEMTVVPPEIESFQIDFDALEAAIDTHTKAVIVNSPNNPSGAVYSAETISKLAGLLRRKSAEVGHTIWLLSDEPYRELNFTGAPLPWLPGYYDDTLVCYSFSKSLSLPGERIGYVLVPPAAADASLVYAAICGAGRSLGYVCAPSLFQKVAAVCAGQTSDLSVYAANRELLLNGLREMGYHCVAPGGSFYLFPRSLEPDARAFCERAKKYELLLVPGDSFGAPGHVRIAYCVPTERVERALPAFAKLAAEYK